MKIEIHLRITKEAFYGSLFFIIIFLCFSSEEKLLYKSKDLDIYPAQLYTLNEKKEG